MEQATATVTAGRELECTGRGFNRDRHRAEDEPKDAEHLNSDHGKNQQFMQAGLTDVPVQALSIERDDDPKGANHLPVFGVPRHPTGSGRHSSEPSFKCAGAEARPPLRATRKRRAGRAASYRTPSSASNPRMS